MRARAVLSALADLLNLIIDNPHTPGDLLFHSYVRTRRYMGSKDRRELADHFYTCLRHLGSIQAASPAINPQAWAWTYAFSFASDLLSNPPSGPHDLPDFPPPKPLDLSQNFPAEFLDLSPSLDLCKALLEPAPLDLRVNTLKKSREDLLKDPDCPAGAEPTPYSPWGLRLKRQSLEQHSWIKNGWVEVQDEGSQLIALATNARPGLRILDFCAGTGGKTLVLAAMMENKGEIIGTDVEDHRLQKLATRLERAGAHNIKIKKLPHLSGEFDIVLVDAPCSGSGTWRRSPWLKKRAIDWPMLLKTQEEILDHAAKFVTSGGSLFYATCSLYPQENEEQVRKFLEKHPSFNLVPLLFPLSLLKEGNLSLNPLQTKTDGFFAAHLKKML